MKEGWTYKKLGEVCNIGIGRTPSRSDMSLWDKNKQTQNYWVSIADMGATDSGYITDTKEYISDKAADNIQIIPKGTLLLSFKLTLGKTAIAGTDLYTNEAIANLPFIGNEVNREFLSYYFQYFNWEKYSVGDEKVLGKTLNKKKLEVLPVYYPVLSEQHRIVSRLDSAFAHIDELKANAEKQLSEARALFQKALTKAMEPKEGWEEKKLEELCEIKSILVDPTEEQYRSLIHVGGANIVSGTGELIELKTAAEEELTSGKFTFDDNDVLYNKIRPYLIKVSRPNFSGLCSADMYPLTSKKGMTRDYLYYILVSRDFTDYAIMNSARAGMPKLNRQALFAYKCMVPPLSEQQRIVSRLDSLSAHVRELEEVTQKTIAECDALKQALLRKVFE